MTAAEAATPVGAGGLSAGLGRRVRDWGPAAALLEEPGDRCVVERRFRRASTRTTHLVRRAPRGWPSVHCCEG